MPIGGTTGPFHLTSARVDEAAAWIWEHREKGGHFAVPTLVARFGLTAMEAVQAVRDGNARLAR